MTRQWRKGDVVPLENLRGITGEEIAPTWYAVNVPHGKERATKEYLKARGIHCCYPTHERTYRIRGRVHRRSFPIITRIVYVKFQREPQWDVMKARKLITGVFSYGETPIKIPKDIISGVMGLPTEAERLEAAQRELMRIREGDRAEITVGPLSGALVDVERVAEGRIWFATLTGIKGDARPDSLLRKADAKGCAIG